MGWEEEEGRKEEVKGGEDIKIEEEGGWEGGDEVGWKEEGELEGEQD